MDKIEQHINKITKLIKEIGASAADYLRLAEDILIGMNISEHKRFTTAIDEISKFEVAGVKNITDIISVFNSFDEILIQVDIISDTVSNETYAKYIIFNKSETYSVNIHTDRTKIIDAVDTIKKIMYERSIISEVIALSDAEKNTDDLVKFIIDNPRINSISVAILNKIVPSASSKKASDIMDIIEGHKDDTLDCPHGKIKQLDIAHHGLVPVKMFMIEQLIENIGGKFDKELSPEENISKFCADKNMIVFLITRTEGSKINYNILPLISQEYIIENKLEGGIGTNGLNKNLLERLNTVYEIKCADKKSGTSSYSKLIGDSSKAEFGYIIEELCGYFRILTNAYPTLKLSSEFILNITKGTSSRIQCYNQLLDSQIINKCKIESFESLMLSFDEYKETLPESYSIKKRIVDLFNEYIYNQLEKIPKDEEQLKELIEKVPLYDIVNITLSKSFILFNPNNVEIKLTYLARFNYVLEKTRKKLISTFKATRFDYSNWNKISKDELRKYIISMFSEIITKTVDALDKSPSLWTMTDFTLKEYYVNKKVLL